MLSMSPIIKLMTAMFLMTITDNMRHNKKDTAKAMSLHTDSELSQEENSAQEEQDALFCASKILCFEKALNNIFFISHTDKLPIYNIIAMLFFQVLF